MWFERERESEGVSGSGLDPAVLWSYMVWYGICCMVLYCIVKWLIAFCLDGCCVLCLVSGVWCLVAKRQYK